MAEPEPHLRRQGRGRGRRERRSRRDRLRRHHRRRGVRGRHGRPTCRSISAPTRFIPGFEDQLLGAKAGDDLTINVTFPENYGTATLAGKPASFKVKVKDVQAPGELAIDDELAKGFGMESLDTLKDSRARLALPRDSSNVSRRKLKRQLLDALDGAVHFRAASLAAGAGVREHLEAGRSRTCSSRARPSLTKRRPRKKPAPSTSKIAERRVRLGLVLAEIGEQAKVQITDEEVTQALVERARQFPGQERHGMGLLPARTRRPWPSSALRSSRTRSSITSSRRLRSRKSRCRRMS